MSASCPGCGAPMGPPTCHYCGRENTRQGINRAAPPDYVHWPDVYDDAMDSAALIATMYAASADYALMDAVVCCAVSTALGRWDDVEAFADKARAHRASAVPA